MRKQKKTRMKTIVIWCITLLAIAVGLLLYSLAGPSEGVILLPADPIYSVSWEPYLTEVAIGLKFKKVSVLTWADQKELEQYMSDAKNLNILFAETPVDYNLKFLEKNKLISEIPEKVLRQMNFFTGFTNIIKTVSGSTYVGLPFSFNPWMVLAPSKNKNNKPSAIIAIPGKSDTAAITIFALADWITGAKEEGLKLLLDHQQNKIFQRSAFSWNQSDALLSFFDGDSSFCFLPLSVYNTFSVNQVLSTQISVMPDAITTNPVPIIAQATVLVFPSKNKTKGKVIEKLLSLVSDKNLQFKIADSRGWMPARSDTIVRDVQWDMIREQARLSDSFIIPELLIDSEEEKTSLLEDIRFKLRSR